MNGYLLLGEVGLLILTLYLYKRRPQALERRIVDLEGIVNRQVGEIYELTKKVVRLEKCNARLIREGLKLEAQVVELGAEPKFRFSNLEGARDESSTTD